MARNDVSQKSNFFDGLSPQAPTTAAKVTAKTTCVALSSLIRSRERNRMHARKTRQRKKEHMMNLQARADQLKEEQVQFKQIIDEKTTASILLVMSGFASEIGDPALPAVSMSAPVEALVRRPNSEIPDSSKISELPEIPPLFGSKKRKRCESDCPADEEGSQEDFEAFLRAGNFPDDGIDYALLGKDRSKCCTAELDKIRRERNRMHAKRTRDRKRLYMEEMEKVINQLEEENITLQNHVKLFVPSVVLLGSGPSSSCDSRSKTPSNMNEQLPQHNSLCLSPASQTFENREDDCRATNEPDASRIVSATSSGSNSLCDEYDNLDEVIRTPSFDLTRYPSKHRRLNENNSEQIVLVSVMA